MMSTSTATLAGQKRPTNVSINEQLLATAKALHINVSKAAEQGLAQAVARKRAGLWFEENRVALESSNEHVAKYSLPLAKYQRF